MPSAPHDESRRLALIKHSFSTGLEYAKKPPPFSSKAVLEFHDAVELFVQLVAEHLGVTVSKKADFLEYWPALTAHIGVDFPQQPAMKRLNQARVGLKHQGIQPSDGDIADLARKTTSFFDEASRLVFGCGFFELSSVSLVAYEPAASRLRRAEALAATGEYDDAAQMCALAFQELLDLFLAQHEDYGSRSPFPALNRATQAPFLGSQWDRANPRLKEHLERLSDAFDEIEPVLLMLSLGLEYRQYARFKRVTPSIDEMMDNSVTIESSAEPVSESDIRFAVDFVTQMALRLRELDPTPPSNLDAEHPFHSEPTWTVMMRDRGTGAEHPIHATVTEIGGGFEAWIFHGKHLARVWHGDSREAALQ